MVFSTFVFSVFLISVSFLGYAQCKDPQLTPFGKKCRPLISDEDFYIVFATNYKDDEELAKAVKEGSKNFDEVLGIPIDKSAVKKVDEEDKKLGDAKITPELLFHAYTYAISKLFRKLGILNDDNIDDLAQEFADEIKKAAKDLDKNDIFATFKALTTAVATFLKSKGANTEENEKHFNRFYFQELDKYRE